MGTLKEKQTVTEFKEIIVGYQCDVCKKIENVKSTPDDWHSFSHQHNEWGNDSCDSYEYHLVCSPKCYAIKFNECIKDLDGCYDAKIDEFEIDFARKLNLTLNP